MDIFSKLVARGQYTFNAINEEGDSEGEVKSWADIEELGIDVLTIEVLDETGCCMGDIFIVLESDQDPDERVTDYSTFLENL